MDHVEQQRPHLARSLHDILQEFIVIIMQLRGAVDRDDRSDSSRRIEYGLQAAERGLDQSRLLLQEMQQTTARPISDGPTTLFGAMHETLDEVLGWTSVRFALRCPREVTLPPIIQREFLSIVREAAINVVKHADARQVDCQVLVDGWRLRLELTDDGRGTALRPASPGHGVRGMQERAASIGATFEMRTARHAGVTVALTLPCWSQRERSKMCPETRPSDVLDRSEVSHAY